MLGSAALSCEINPYNGSTLAMGRLESSTAELADMVFDGSLLFQVSLTVEIVFDGVEQLISPHKPSASRAPHGKRTNVVGNAGGVAHPFRLNA